MGGRAKRLLTAGLAALMAATVLSATAELYLRRRPLARASGPALRQDPLLGWDSIPAIAALDNTGQASVVYFVGDSFTHDRQWPRVAQHEAARQGVRFDGYSLGVSGFGTTQEWLKIERDFDRHRPWLVVVQLFAWNDLRDNWRYPSIAYGVETSSRPYLIPGAGGYRLLPARSSTPLRWLEATEVWRRVFFRATLRADDVAARIAVDRLAQWRVPLTVHYTETATWEPFYRTDRADTPYVREALAVTREALRRLSAFLASHGSRLAVVGLDNPFTVDDDVAAAWIRPGIPFDPDLPLKEIERLSREDGWRFESARPALLEARGRTKRKVYNPPAGDLSGHLEPAGEDAVGAVAAKLIVELAATSP
jgi:hypothetical protein